MCLTTRDPRQLFESFQSRIDIDKQVRVFLYILGLTNYKVKHVGDVLEFKESNREPGKFKCYKLVRFSVTTSNKLDLLNLVDPLMLSKNLFLPIPRENPSKAIKSVVKANQGISCSYKGMNLSSNLCRLVEDNNEMARLYERAIDVPPELFYKEFQGIIVKIDIANYGKLSLSVLNGPKAFFLDSKRIAVEYELSIHRLFVQLLAEYSVLHYTVLGDGFLGAFPDASFSRVEAISSIAGICSRMQEYVDWVNTELGYELISYRCSLFYGQYNYGRFNLYETTPYISGQDLVKTTRLEEGLKEIIKQSNSRRHVVLDKDTYVQFKGIFDQWFVVDETPVMIESKETKIEGYLCDVKKDA